MQTAQSMFVIDFKIVISITIYCGCEYTTINRYIFKVVLLYVCFTDVEAVRSTSESKTVVYKKIFSSLDHYHIKPSYKTQHNTK